MFRPRLIPTLLLKNNGLVKSVQFKNHRYIGDPINAVKIFNDLGADELIIMDIMATRENRSISLDFIHKVGEEANMPFGVGGGIRTLNEIKQIISAGAEKVILNTYALQNPDFIKEASDEFGSSTIVVAIDVKKNFFRKESAYINSGTKETKFDPVSFCRIAESKGAGEIIINSIERDGTMKGYDLSLIKRVSKEVKIPVVALGGAGDYDDFRKAIHESMASAVAAGSFFIYHGPRKAVLINYPCKEEINKIFE